MKALHRTLTSFGYWIVLVSLVMVLSTVLGFQAAFAMGTGGTAAPNKPVGNTNSTAHSDDNVTVDEDGAVMTKATGCTASRIKAAKEDVKRDTSPGKKNSALSQQFLNYCAQQEGTVVARTPGGKTITCIKTDDQCFDENGEELKLAIQNGTAAAIAGGPDSGVSPILPSRLPQNASLTGGQVFNAAFQGGSLEQQIRNLGIESEVAQENFNGYVQTLRGYAEEANQSPITNAGPNAFSPSEVAMLEALRSEVKSLAPEAPPALPGAGYTPPEGARVATKSLGDVVIPTAIVPTAPTGDPNNTTGFQSLDGGDESDNLIPGGTDELIIRRQIAQAQIDQFQEEQRRLWGGSLADRAKAFQRWVSPPQDVQDAQDLLESTKVKATQLATQRGFTLEQLESGLGTAASVLNEINPFYVPPAGAATNITGPVYIAMLSKPGVGQRGSELIAKGYDKSGINPNAWYTFASVDPSTPLKLGEQQTTIGEFASRTTGSPLVTRTSLENNFNLEQSPIFSAGFDPETKQRILNRQTLADYFANIDAGRSRFVSGTDSLIIGPVVEGTEEQRSGPTRIVITPEERGLRGRITGLPASGAVSGTTLPVPNPRRGNTFPRGGATTRPPAEPPTRTSVTTPPLLRSMPSNIAPSPNLAQNFGDLLAGLFQPRGGGAPASPVGQPVGARPQVGGAGGRVPQQAQVPAPRPVSGGARIPAPVQERREPTLGEQVAKLLEPVLSAFQLPASRSVPPRVPAQPVVPVRAAGQEQARPPLGVATPTPPIVASREVPRTEPPQRPDPAPQRNPEDFNEVTRSGLANRALDALGRVATALDPRNFFGTPAAAQPSRLQRYRDGTYWPADDRGRHIAANSINNLFGMKDKAEFDAAIQAAQQAGHMPGITLPGNPQRLTYQPFNSRSDAVAAYMAKLTYQSNYTKCRGRDWECVASVYVGADYQNPNASARRHVANSGMPGNTPIPDLKNEEAWVRWMKKVSAAEYKSMERYGLRPLTEQEIREGFKKFHGRALAGGSVDPNRSVVAHDPKNPPGQPGSAAASAPPKQIRPQEFIRQTVGELEKQLGCTGRECRQKKFDQRVMERYKGARYTDRAGLSASTIIADQAACRALGGACGKVALIAAQDGIEVDFTGEPNADAKRAAYVAAYSQALREMGLLSGVGVNSVCDSKNCMVQVSSRIEGTGVRAQTRDGKWALGDVSSVENEDLRRVLEGIQYDGKVSTALLDKTVNGVRESIRASNITPTAAPNAAGASAAQGALNKFVAEQKEKGFAFGTPDSTQPNLTPEQVARLNEEQRKNLRVYERQKDGTYIPTGTWEAYPDTKAREALTRIEEALRAEQLNADERFAGLKGSGGQLGVRGGNVILTNKDGTTEIVGRVENFGTDKTITRAILDKAGIKYSYRDGKFFDEKGEELKLVDEGIKRIESAPRKIFERTFTSKGKRYTGKFVRNPNVEHKKVTPEQFKAGLRERMEAQGLRLIDKSGASQNPRTVGQENTMEGTMMHGTMGDDRHITNFCIRQNNAGSNCTQMMMHRDGTIVIIAPLNSVTYHAPSMNRLGPGIEIMGADNGNDLTDRQLQALKIYRDYTVDELGWFIATQGRAEPGRKNVDECGPRCVALVYGPGGPQDVQHYSVGTVNRNTGAITPLSSVLPVTSLGSVTPKPVFISGDGSTITNLPKIKTGEVTVTPTITPEGPGLTYSYTPPPPPKTPPAGSSRTRYRTPAGTLRAGLQQFQQQMQGLFSRFFGGAAAPGASSAPTAPASPGAPTPATPTTLTPTGPVRVSQFVCDPAMVFKGKKTSISVSWRCENTTTSTGLGAAQGMIGNLSTGGRAQGSTTVSVTTSSNETGRLGIRCGEGVRSSTAFCSIAVLNPVISLLAYPEQVARGGSVDIEWRATGLTRGAVERSCALYAFGPREIARGGSSGTVTVENVTESSRFKLLCETDAGKPATASVDVRVRGSASPARDFEAPVAAFSSQFRSVRSGVFGNSSATTFGTSNPFVSSSSSAEVANNAFSDGIQATDDQGNVITLCDPAWGISRFTRCLLENNTN